MKTHVIFALLLSVSAVAFAQPTDTPPILVLNARGHTDSIPMVRFSADGKQLISVGKDKQVLVWSTATGELLRTIRMPVGNGMLGLLASVAVSRDGKLLAVAGVGPAEGDHWIYLLDFASGQIQRVLKGCTGREIFDLAFAPEGNLVAATDLSAAVRIWDTSTGAIDKVLEGHTAGVNNLAFSPDGKQLATSSRDGTTRIWSVASGISQAVLTDPYEGRLHWNLAVAWSPDGQTIATGGMDGLLRFWNKEGTLKSRFGPLSNNLVDFAFTPNSRDVLVVPGFMTPDHTCRVRSVDTGQVRVVLPGHRERVRTGAISPDGSLIATAGSANEGIILWRATDGAIVHRLIGKSLTPSAAGWSPDGKSIGWGHATGGEVDFNRAGSLDWSFHLDTLDFGPIPDYSFQRFQTTDGAGTLRPSLGKPGLESPRLFLEMLRDGEVVQTYAPRDKGELVKSATLLGPSYVVLATHYIALFERMSGKKLRELAGPTGGTRALAPSPDGRVPAGGLGRSDDSHLAAGPNPTFAFVLLCRPRLDRLDARGLLCRIAGGRAAHGVASE